MHVIIPFAAPLSEAGRTAARKLQLPCLQALLAASHEQGRISGDEYSLSTPHECAWGLALGLTGGDGALPWAAHAAARDGITTLDLAWGLLTPVHWRIGTEQVSLTDPDSLALDEAASRELFEAVKPLFVSEGMALAYGAPTRWYVAHASLRDLPTASLDRVIGRNVDRWLPDARSVRLIRRLQSEVQMLWHDHPINAVREAQGLPAVNSFWLSGCGVAQPTQAASDLRLDDRLRRPALAEDWATWAQAWAALDASVIAEAVLFARRGQSVRVTLCGERCALTLSAQRPTLWQRLRQPWQRNALPDLLESL